MKPHYIIIFLLFLSLSTNAQDGITIQTIETRNGVTYEGWVIDNLDDVVRLETLEGDTLIFSDDEIVRWSNPFYFVFKGNRFHKKTGSFAVINAAFGGRSNATTGGRSDGFTLQFTYTYGKRVTPRTLVGLGTGFNFTGDFDVLASQEFFGELYLYFRHYLNDKRFRPFVETKLGAFTGIENRIRDDLNPGPIIQGGLGLEFGQRTETRLSVKINYMFLYAIAKRTSLRNILDDVNIKRSLFVIGFNF